MRLHEKATKHLHLKMAIMKPCKDINKFSYQLNLMPWHTSSWPSKFRSNFAPRSTWTSEIFFRFFFFFTNLPNVIPSCSYCLYRCHHVVTCQKGQKKPQTLPDFWSSNGINLSWKKMIIIKKLPCGHFSQRYKSPCIYLLQKFRIVIFVQTSLINNTSVTLSSKEGKSPKNSI